jgi:hypothetical protein
MLEFLDRWIENGSYSIYGGGKDNYGGEGAGCADFARVFFEIATGETMPQDWMVKRILPPALVGTKERPVSILDVFVSGDRWGSSELNAEKYISPDPGLAFRWIKQTLSKGYADATYYWPNVRGLEPPAPLPSFRHKRIPRVSPEVLWSSIAQ